MPTLALTLSGPIQAWGVGSKFSVRQTDLVPSKSGVLGLVAAAQGLRRTEPITELAGLRFGVRADQPGRLLRDFQTARAEDGKGASISQRYYLSDAVFLAALEHDDGAWLERIHDCLRRPVFPLYLGRRSCPPSGPIPAFILDATIERVFEETPWQASRAERIRQRDFPEVAIETHIDSDPGKPGTVWKRDVPVSFDPEHREHRWREVSLSQVWLANPEFREREPALAKRSGDRESLDSIAHNVFAAMEEGD